MLAPAESSDAWTALGRAPRHPWFPKAVSAGLPSGQPAKRAGIARKPSSKCHAAAYVTLVALHTVPSLRGHAAAAAAMLAHASLAIQPHA